MHSQRVLMNLPGVTVFVCFCLAKNAANRGMWEMGAVFPMPVCIYKKSWLSLSQKSIILQKEVKILSYLVSTAGWLEI